MATTVQAIDVYRQLAEEHHRRNHPQERDRFLLLAADAALAAGNREEAERFRRSILSQNPSHLLKPYASLDEALKSADILAYIQQLRRSFPQDKAATLLESLRKSAPSSPAMLRQQDGEEDIILPLDADRGGKPASPALDKPAARAIARPKETQMNDAQQPGRSPSSPPSPWQQGATPKEPAAGPGIFGLRPEPPPAPRPPLLPLPGAPAPAPADAPEETPAGAWVGSFLSFVVVLTAIALLVYTIGAPFVTWW